MLPRNPRFSEN